jgi:YgiT-type zinc finger domain-containing protein
MKAIPAQSCEFCNGALKPRVVRARFHYKGQTIYINHVPAWVCGRCGEQEFDGPVYERMEEIARNPRRITGTITFPLADYDEGGPTRGAKPRKRAPREESVTV